VRRAAPVLPTWRLRTGVISIIVLLVVGLTPRTAVAAASAVTVPCSGPNGGEPGLVAAIDAANSAGGGARIVLAAGCTYTLTHNFDVPDGGGLPAITTNLLIGAPDPSSPATIVRASSAPPFSILNVDAPGALTLANVTVAGGLAVDGFAGGGIGVASGASLHLVGSRVTANTAIGQNEVAAEGGGIYSRGDVTVDQSRVDHNLATNNAPGQLAVGGGIGNEATDAARPATLTVRNSSIDHNRVSAPNGNSPGAVGAGVATLGVARATITRSDVTENRAEAGGINGAALGGGLFDNLSFFTGQADTATDVEGGRLTGNTVSAHGGGFGAGAAVYDGTGDKTTIAETNISDNRATADGNAATAAGGAIYEEPATTLVVVDETVIARNSATASGDTSQALGGALANSGDATLGDAHLTRNSTSGSGAGSIARGGGVWTSTTTATGDELHLARTTIDYNRATAGPGAAAGGGLYLDQGTVTITAAATIRRNIPDNCAPTNSVAGC
jgi:hypothetical protein